jgi:hypothetical protein
MSCHMLELAYHLLPWRPHLLVHDRQRDTIRSISPASALLDCPNTNETLFIATSAEIDSILQTDRPEHINILCIDGVERPTLRDTRYKGTNLIIIQEKDTRFEDLTKVLMEALMGLRNYPSPHEILMNALASNGKNALACAIEQILGNPVFIRDTSLELLSTSVEGHYVNAENFHSQGFCTPAMIESMNIVTHPCHLKSDNKLEGCIFAPIFIHNIPVAYLFSATHHVEVLPEDLCLADLAAQAVAIEMQKSPMYRFKSGFSYDYFLIRLLESQSITQYFIDSYLRNLQLSFTSNIFVAVFELPESSLDNTFLVKTISKDLARICKAKLYAVYKNSVVMIFCRDDYEPFSAIQRDELEAYLNKRNIFAGISQSFSCINDTAQYYNQALDALVQARLLDLPGPLFDIQKMMVYTILSSYSVNHDLYTCLPPKVRNLLAYDKSEQLEYFKTLSVLIRHGMSIKNTADELFLHRNTVQYRLRKIRELFDIDLSHSEDLFQIMLAQYILDLTQKGHGSSENKTLNPLLISSLS